MALHEMEQRKRRYEVVYYKRVNIEEDNAKRLVKVLAEIEMLTPKKGVVKVAVMQSLDKNREITICKGEEEKELGEKKQLALCYEYKEIF